MTRFFDILRKVNIFFELDFKSSFHQINVVNKDTRNSVYEMIHKYCDCLLVVMRLRNGPVTLQQLMNSFSSNSIDDFAYIYLNNLLTNNNWKQSYPTHLEVFCFHDFKITDCELEDKIAICIQLRQDVKVYSFEKMSQTLVYNKI